MFQMLGLCKDGLANHTDVGVSLETLGGFQGNRTGTRRGTRWYVFGYTHKRIQTTQGELRTRGTRPRHTQDNISREPGEEHGHQGNYGGRVDLLCLLKDLVTTPVMLVYFYHALYAPLCGCFRLVSPRVLFSPFP